MKNKIRAGVFIILTGAISILITGCSTPPLTINYAPSSTLTVEGAINVAGFEYLPAKNGAVKENQVRNTALGKVIFEKNINVIFQEAVFKEFRFVGVKPTDKEHELTGNIEEFLIDDLGYSVDWTLRVKYVVKNVKSGSTVYEKLHEYKRKTNKFGNVFGTLNEIIKCNIEELLKDKDFTQLIKK